MPVSGKLFIKVFLAFWLVTLAVLGSWMLADAYFDTVPLALPEESPRAPGPPHRQLLRLIYDLQNLELDELRDTLERVRKDQHLQVYLLDRDGGELYGRSVPGFAREAASRLDSGRRRAVQVGPEGRVVVQAIHRRDQGPLRAVIHFERPRGQLLRALGASPGLRLALAVLVSGLVCFVLSRLVTNRLKALQATARRISDGDLDARIAVRDRGGDETDELARDFNAMADQLQERIQAQRRLLSDVSHELRSPLARLRIALALAEEDAGGRRDALRRIEQEAERLEELIAQLLSSRAEHPELDVHIDLVPLLRQLCADADFEGKGSDKGVVFETGCHEAVVASAGDLLRKCFENLLRNAVAHTRPGSQVLVDLRTQRESVVVTVDDQGPGIPDDALEKVFEAFYRVDTARTRGSGGYGLGLSIARRAVEQHGGDIAAANTGNGLRITVTLPWDADQARHR